jgi:AP-1 complex subunit mu
MTIFTVKKFKNNKIVLSATQYNSNAALAMEFLHKLAEVFSAYFGKLEEESIKDNFVVVYELLDEMMDFGYPQTTETDLLKDFIKVETHKLKSINLDGSLFDVMKDLTSIGTQEVVNKLGLKLSSTEDTTKQLYVPKAMTNSVSWRKDDIFYKKNEVFLDVIESVNMIATSQGQTIFSEVVGSLKMRSQLSGMPTLKLGLNDKVLFEILGKSETAQKKAVELEDVKFHQCVSLEKFRTERTIIFTPPDGAFDLMNYRLNVQVKPLIVVKKDVQSYSNKRFKYFITAKTLFKPKSSANNVKIYIPVPKDASTSSMKTQIGQLSYIPSKDCIMWSIPTFQGGKVVDAFIEVEVNQETTEEKKPVTVEFEIPYYTISGLQVRYLKVSEKSGYNALPWVRYFTRSGDYQVRQ